MNAQLSAGARAASAVREGLKASVKTAFFLLRIMVPVSLVVALLGWSGVLAQAAGLLKPVMGLIGLPGDAALVWLSSIFLNIYSAIAVMNGLASIGMREATILAIMCLIAHNMIVETTVMKKTGSSALEMILLRLFIAIVAGLSFNLLLPADMGPYSFSMPATGSALSIGELLLSWMVSTLWLIGKIALIVVVIMVAQKTLQEFKIADLLARFLSPFMRIFGLSGASSFLWIIINVVGYAYGAGVIMEEVQGGKMKRQDADLFNHHAAISHSLLEDSMLFLVIGLPLFWIVVPRLILAMIVVWSERLRQLLFRRSFRVGTH